MNIHLHSTARVSSRLLSPHLSLTSFLSPPPLPLVNLCYNYQHCFSVHHDFPLPTLTTPPLPSPPLPSPSPPLLSLLPTKQNKQGVWFHNRGVARYYRTYYQASTTPESIHAELELALSDFIDAINDGTFSISPDGYAMAAQVRLPSSSSSSTLLSSLFLLSYHF